MGPGLPDGLAEQLHVLAELIQEHISGGKNSIKKSSPYIDYCKGGNVRFISHLYGHLDLSLVNRY